jgi:uncharacterized protein
MLGSASAATVVMSPAELIALRSPSIEQESQAATEPAIAVLDAPSAVAAALSPDRAEDGIATARTVIADRANEVDVPKLAADLGIGVHLLDDILMSMCRTGIDPRDSLAAPVFRRGIMKLEDLSPGMELSGTVLNVVDFGVFVDIGLSDSGLVHISRLADRFIRDPHEVVGVGDVLKVWVVEVDKNRRRVSLTAIAPGSERPHHHGHREQQRPPREQRPPRAPRPQQGGRSAQGGRPPQQSGAQPAGAGAPPQGQRPPRPSGGGRRDGRGGRPPQPQHPKTVERAPTKPKKFKPITKAQEEGKEPMRSFSDLMQLFDKKKKPPEAGESQPGGSSA